MKSDNRYPSLNIRSKNELAKRISSKKFPYQDALDLINDVLENRDRYWKDSNASDIENDKYVRTAIGTPLGKLLKLIDKRILKTHDSDLPDFIYGSVSGKSHLHAAHRLIGVRRKRVLIKYDLKRFYEQVEKKRVYDFFHHKCNCSVKASKLLAFLCCVPFGPKGRCSKREVLGRGFSTSPRLATWSNLDTFQHLEWRVKRILRKNDARLVLFVDDIGVMGSRINESQIKSVKETVENTLAAFDGNQPLKINKDKTEVVDYSQNPEHLGAKLGRNKISMSRKSLNKKKNVIRKLKHASRTDRSRLVKQKKAYNIYQNQFDQINKGANDHGRSTD